ncbi:hypothetical protein KDN32_07470 [Nocardioides sp. J2M5]|uniref:discoidin domain-containing protein n=1 Tax=Nocardioides palaemonis TaxID=2829810 RepID=UPI001BAB5BB3|nr:discoidin domain-containing protein [Nocardioides palaemonis]MBS2937578.1 hypothetical protein [Nocardioides palaemonis]
MDTCVRCGAELGVGRFCLNCGHRIGDPAPASAHPPAPRPAAPAAASPPPPPPPPVRAAEVAEAPPVEVPVQAADPTPVPPTRVPEPARARRGLRRPAPTPAPAPSAWDPDEELLPYHDADELGPDDPLPPRGWILWVAGAVALLAVALLLLRVLDTSDDDTVDAATDTSTAVASEPTAGADGGEEAGEEQPAVPQGVGERFDAAAGATFGVPATAPPTTDLDGDLVAYDAAQMGDGIPATAWRTAGSAAGQAITVTLAGPTVVDRVGLVNGYAKQVEGVDWYPNNRRVLSVTWTFDDGSTVEQTLAERPGMQRLKVPPVTTSTVTLTLGEVTAPGAGPLGRDYTAISEISVLGRQAG